VQFPQKALAILTYCDTNTSHWFVLGIPLTGPEIPDPSPAPSED